MGSKTTFQPKLTIAVSSRSLFHMEDGHKIYNEHGQQAFDEYMHARKDVPLRPGPAFSLVKKLLAINNDKENPLVDVVILSRNSTRAGLRIHQSCKHYELSINRALFTTGQDRFKYAKAFGAHLFLSASSEDVKRSLEHGIAAARLVGSEHPNPEDYQIRLAFDGDSVLFNSEADDVYRSLGLAAFNKHESTHADTPLGEGPMKKFVMALRDVQQSFSPEECPISIGLFTARGFESSERALNTLHHWGVRVDHSAFCAGTEKGPLLHAFQPDMFFDDTRSNIESALRYSVASGHVPFGVGGIESSPSSN